MIRINNNIRWANRKRWLGGGSAVFLILLTVAASEGELAPWKTELDSARAENGALQTTFGYWNDNFLVRLPGDYSGNENRDDFQTASFWVRMADGHSGRWWFADANYAILTDRAASFRSDLLALRFSIERPAPMGPLQAGLGIVASGDFGGSGIQNAFHRMFGYREVNLPYSGETTGGGIAFLRWNPILRRGTLGDLGGYVSNHFRTSVVPCNLRSGLEYRVDGRAGRLHWQAQSLAGYTGYYCRSGRLETFFEDGFTWGLMISGGILEHCNTAVWLTNNQYGLKQYQFGISVTTGWTGHRQADLNDVTFP